MKETLITVYNFLNQLEVKGAGNVQLLFKSQYLLEQLLNDIQKTEMEEQKEEASQGG